MARMRETPDCAGQRDEIARARSAMQEIKDAVQRNKDRVGDMYASMDMQRFYRQLQAATFPAERAVLHKQEVLHELRGRKLLDETLLRQFPAIYVGSGIDFEYPVLMGARRVMLVDPILSDEKARQTLIQRVGQVVPVTETEREVHFEIDFESGKTEAVILEIHPEIYGGLPDMPHMKNQAAHFASFQTDEPIALLLGFRTEGMDIDTDFKIMEQIVPGGIVLADHMSSQYLHELSDAEKGELFHDSDHYDIRAICGSLQRYWQRRGFDFVPLQFEGDSYHYTCLRKREAV